MTQSWDPNTGAQPAGDPAGGNAPYGGYAQQPGYSPQPGYGAAGYPGGQPGYPPQPGYPGQPGYPAGYPAYPPAGPTRPGAVTAAAVLAFVQAGFVIIAGITLLAGGTSMIDYGGRVSGLGTEWTIVAIATIICGAVILGGGVQLFKGKRGLVVIGSALSLLISVYWLIRIMSFEVNLGPALVWPLIFAVLPVIVISLTLGSSAKTWAESKVA